MKKSLNLLTAAIVVLVCTSLSNGQEGSVASVRSSRAAEFSFETPSGWNRRQDGDAYMLVSPAESIYIIVQPHSERDPADAVRASEIDSSYRVIGGLKTLQNGAKTFRVSKQMKNGSTGIVDVFVLMSPSGFGGALVLALSGPANADAAFAAGVNVARSISFGESDRVVAASAGAAPSSAGSEWGSRLAGKHLLYLYSSSGYFEEKHIYLCSSGTFVQTTGSGGFTPGDADGGSFAARGGRRGRWDVSGSSLVLRFQDGAVAQYNVTQRQKSNEIGLNGSRYFIDGTAGC